MKENKIEIKYNTITKKWVIRAYYNGIQEVYNSAKENEGLEFMAALSNCMIQVREREKKRSKK